MIFGNAWPLVDHVLEGTQDNWPFDFWLSIRAAITMTATDFWRRLVHFFSAWPWKAARIFDPRLSFEERKAAALELLGTADCCLDSGFSLKMKRMFNIWEALMSTKAQAFGLQMFNSVVLTTVQAEETFARFRQWLLRSLKPLSLPMLSATYVVDGFRSGHAAVMSRRRIIRAKRSKMGRPIWAQLARGKQRVNGEHMFMSDFMVGGQHSFIEAKQAFAVEPGAAKKEWRSRAKNNNCASKAFRHAAVSSSQAYWQEGRKEGGFGPWALGDRQYAYGAANLCADGYGIERGFVQKAAAEWQQSSGFRVFNSPDMPKHVLKLRKYCSRSYSRCEASITAPKRVEDV